jgi:2-hydroxy-6-oxonona-2,4-dienedioate hydrolase
MSDLPEHISIWGELADTDHELRHVDVHGVRTRVLRAGAGQDLVLLHGTGGHLEAYARDIAGLAADFRVTAYDMVGHGWSDLPDRPYTIDVLSDHLTGLMDALAIPSAHLSGESLGGWVAAWTAAHQPDRVGRMVLNTPGNIANKPEVMKRLVESTTAAVRDPSDATVRRRVEFLFHHTEMVTDELVNLRRAVYSRPGFLTAIGNTLVLQDPEIRKDFAWDPSWVGKITAPTLLLWTDHDPTGGLDEAEMLLGWLPDARLQVIEDAGHWPQWEKREAFLQIHRDFLLPAVADGPVAGASVANDSVAADTSGAATP